MGGMKTEYPRYCQQNASTFLFNSKRDALRFCRNRDLFPFERIEESISLFLPWETNTRSEEILAGQYNLNLKINRNIVINISRSI